MPATTSTDISHPYKSVRKARAYNGLTRGIPELDISQQIPPPIVSCSRALRLNQQRKKIKKNIGSSMSYITLAHILAKRGCENLNHLLTDDCSEYPVSTGGFGDVYRAQLNDDRTVAIKTIRIFTSDGPGKYHKRAAREIYTWAKCRHPNIVELIGLVTFKGSLGMVSRWAENGNLLSYIKKPPSVDRFQLSEQICAGLTYLHTQSIVHGDLKAENVLISATGVPMLNDFGNASIQNATLQFSDTNTGIKCSTRWAAPEILDGTGIADTKSDIYALGMTILETFTGEVPYPKLTRDVTVITHVLVKKQLPARPRSLKENCQLGDRHWDILVLCWSHDPEDRPIPSDVRDAFTAK